MGMTLVQVSMGSNTANKGMDLPIEPLVVCSEYSFLENIHIPIEEMKNDTAQESSNNRVIHLLKHVHLLCILGTPIEAAMWVP